FLGSRQRFLSARAAGVIFRFSPRASRKKVSRMGIFSKKDETTVSESDVLNALSRVKDPDLHQDVVKLGFIKNLSIREGNVAFDFVLTTPACPAKDQMRDDAQSLVSALPGVKNVQINMQAEVRQQPSYDRNSIAGVKNVVAICSGKGGVGK